MECSKNINENKLEKENNNDNKININKEEENNETNNEGNDYKFLKDDKILSRFSLSEKLYTLFFKII